VLPDGEVDWDDPAELPVELGEGPEKEDWWGCPRRPVLDDPRLFAELSHLYGMREKGFLPYPGSYLEQPNVFVEGMHVLDAVVAEVDRVEDKRRALRAGQQ
jgi:hypothetical protein